MGELKENVVIREMDIEKDLKQVEELERRCEVGSSMSIYTDNLGDPLCRIRNSPAFLMLVAEIYEGDEREMEKKSKIVGIIRGSMRSVSQGNNMKNSNTLSNSRDDPTLAFTKVAYILGLRVSSSHRRYGIARKLVNKIEEWFKTNGAHYSYMATESNNHASLSLFTHKCGYSKFRTPSILVQPVFAHRVGLSSRVSIIGLTPAHAEVLYRTKFTTTEFFPSDIDAVLSNPLTLGTYLALPRGYAWAGPGKFLYDPPESWAVLSVWNCGKVYKLEVGGASSVVKSLVKMGRAVDRALPFLRIPSFPDVFKPFGYLFMYGVGGEGANGGKMVKELCGYVHNMGRAHGCTVVVTEVASQEPLKEAIPYWKKLSCSEDLWCMKKLVMEEEEGCSDWTKSTPPLSIFVDPREI